MKRQILTALLTALLTTTAHGGCIECGKARAVACAGCHGPDGISTVPTYPNLAGQKKGYLVMTLKGFRDGSRKNTIMNPMAKSLTDADIENLAAYYASLE